MSDEKKVLTRGAKVNADITALLKAKNSLLWIVTPEERRAEAAIIEAAAAAKYGVNFWDCATGISDEKNKPVGDMKDPLAAIQKIRTTNSKRVYVMRDLHKWLQPDVLRLLRTTARELQDNIGDTGQQMADRAIIVLSPSGDIPIELSGSVTVIEYPIPDRAEMANILETVIAASDPEGKKNLVTSETRDAAIDSAVGLTADEATNCYARSLVTARRIDPVLVAGEKKRIIAREKVLTWYDADPRGMDAIGGLEALKEWLRVRHLAFSPEARKYGVPLPKGVFLCGISGTGKSLTAKCISAAWQMPLLRLDLGALRSKYVGQSEENIRKALRVAEAVSPAIIWIDEIDKGFAGASGLQGDGGVAADALGTFLTWMQERQGATFCVVTANSIEGLPPELLRKGRFDELFFLDLPIKSERVEILKIAIRASGRVPEAIDHAKVADACAGFVGSEVAAIVPDAMFEAFADGSREITTRDLVSAANRITPLSKTASATMEKMRDWSKGRARKASTAVEEQGNGQRRIDLDDEN